MGYYLTRLEPPPTVEAMQRFQYNCGMLLDGFTNQIGVGTSIQRLPPYEYILEDETVRGEIVLERARHAAFKAGLGDSRIFVNLVVSGWTNQHAS